MTTPWTFEMDLLKELFNIGIGRSADTLSRLVDDEVVIHLHDACLMDNAQSVTSLKRAAFTNDTQQLTFHYTLDFDGHKIPSIVVLLASTEQINRLIGRLYQEEPPPAEPDGPSRDVYQTVMDLFVSTCMGSVADLLAVTMQQQRVLFTNHDLSQSGLPCPSNKPCLCLEIHFSMPSAALEGHLHLLFDAAILPDLTQRYQTILNRAEG
ncbi:CheC, inhibitor of MCP methylation [Magnetococcus marinus MC-1]|uniref:CheC, inhibitor of MCP methylation n=1 Tax=Magnetococcus marinus (strain ATCC BAA-1437 / JCM 17883 / MC-1) TaxID=156889 RepID=A0L5I0_MAGMM|nr:hypothetical protein [Magnetococcus marinus]ABK43223.1 CheC, inhibitor of MCP methylation [Magnetococcus marinus MC-1]